ncbi:MULTISPECIES: hypothetical protein [Flavobacterium]|uniref:Uncharacterized protein n=2 Tax=Flavobacterium TaxID=237 RepID=A0AA94JNB0_9FLAO|nr:MULTISPECIES: hypothetical protein [Flavobacterium]OXA83988.1 hypothetical protein B0A56_00140 [Flavobacterium columnare NBRC 100251 = ATCC 23463]AMA48447.1 hypothetical protein AWN65_02710 [Flavobacterium covae]AND65423.1 hypothetical protein AX766_14055 [Flavobacterium covae]MCH4830375.1 hypothetical protein [Flavobacterium columnare]MCH4833688.1 hypothetical protein [Flavobacterium columnare]
MRKLLSLSLFFICSYSGFSQIKVIPTTPLERLGRVGNNSIYVHKEGNIYTFFYKDIENPEESPIRNFSFKNLENDYENFFKIIIDGFSASPMYDIKLELPNDFIWLHYTKSTAKTTVQFMTTNKATATTGISEAMTLDEVKKLFEKS